EPAAIPDGARAFQASGPGSAESLALLRNGCKGIIRRARGFCRVVDRRTYFRRGAALVLLKYGGDAALIAIAIRRWWTPAHYLDSIYLLYNTFWTQAPAWLLPALMLWTLPFLWIGMRMTMERAEDAGLSPWFSLGFL